MKRIIAFCAVLGSAACTSAAAPPKPPSRAAGTESAAPTAKAETLDSGTFTIALHGQEIGKESFRIDKRGGELEVFSATSLLMGALQISSESVLITDQVWRPVSAEIAVEAGSQKVKSTLGRAESGQLALTSASEGGAPRTTAASGPVDLFMAENTMIHATPLCVAAGASERTLTAFPGMKLVLSPATTERFAPSTMAGTARELTRFTVDLGGSARIELYCDGSRLAIMSIAMASFIAVRDGYGELAASLATTPRKKPEIPASLVELPRTVTVRGTPGLTDTKDAKDARRDSGSIEGRIEAVTLDCSLMLPAAYATVSKRTLRGKTRALPAVVFITGSGSQDRDEDTIGPGGLKLAIFKTMAIALGKAGIASLRCDDRGTGKSTGDFSQTTLGARVADASAAVAALRAEPAVDPRRVGLIGHSEGGIVAPIVATRDPAIAALVLMAGTGRHLDVVILEQVARGARRQGMKESDVAAQVAEFEAAIAAIRAGTPLPESLPEQLRVWLSSTAPWLKSHLGHDPKATAGMIGKTPVLIAQGGKDVQVTIQDAEILRDALTGAGNRRVRYEVYPDLNHLFAVTRTGSLGDYLDPDATVDEGFIADVVEFLGKNL